MYLIHYTIYNIYNIIYFFFKENDFMWLRLYLGD